MYEAGIDALTAMEQLGHSDIKTTLSIYTHLSNQHKENDVKKLDEFFKKGSQGVVSQLA
jgi:integrase